MTFTYDDGEDVYVVDLNEDESAAYVQGGKAKADLKITLLDELHMRGIETWVDVYHVSGEKLYDIPAA